jgi:hypothetical protein
MTIHDNQCYKYIDMLSLANFDLIDWLVFNTNFSNISATVVYIQWCEIFLLLT